MPLKRTSMLSRPFAVLVACLSAIALAQNAPATSPAPAVTPDTVLIQNATVKVTKRDFDLELARIPPEMRGQAMNNQRRIAEIVGRLLVIKTLAHEARAQGLDRDPDVAAKLALETDRLYSQVRQAKFEEQAALEFDSKRAQWEARAREIYALERSRFMTPEQVVASHILFSTQQHKSDEAKKLADEARARIIAGADFNELAKSLSEDPTAKQNGGELGYFGRSEMHSAFADAAFAMKKVGDVSEPVLTSYGWHLIKLEGRKPATQLAFDDVHDLIIAELRQKYVNEQRDAMLAAIGSDSNVKPNVEALQAIHQRPPSAESLRRALPANAPAAAPAR